MCIAVIYLLNTEAYIRPSYITLQNVHELNLSLSESLTLYEWEEGGGTLENELKRIPLLLHGCCLSYFV